MGSECKGTNMTQTNNFPATDIITRNIYQEANKSYTEDYSKYFVSKASQVKYSSILSKLEQQKAKTFKDKNFIIPNSIKLSLLYNYENMKAKVYTSEDTPFTCFTQAQMQFTYLSCIFYLFCSHKYKLNDMFETRVINDFDMYVVKLFCNGNQFDVVIDDTVPVQKESLKFCSLIKGRQIWPVLLQKAWCKEIGGYEQAKGLSPQDAFQQITGIPAYSYDMKYQHATDLEQTLSDNLRKGYWVALTAKQNLRDLGSRQVFYLQSIQNNKFHIRSPYNRYNLAGKPIQDSNMVKITVNQLVSHFQYLTIGFVKPEFETITIKHQSKSKEEVIYELQITKEEEVNIRFIQYYDGYLPIQKRALYQYSPLSIEVYNERYQLQQSWQGCPRAESGARSAHFSQNIFESLRRGRYYIKIEVDWINDTYFNKGAICVYTRKQNASIKLSEQKTKNLLEKFHRKLLANNDNVRQITQNVELRRADKKNGLILQFYNKGKNMQRIKLDLSKTRNVRMKYCDNANNVTTLVMEPNQERSIEVVPMDLRDVLSIESFQVSKV